MTGFGEGAAALAEGRVWVEVRSVNHRQLELRVKAPRELGDPGLFIEQRVRSRLSRGRVEVTLRAEGQGPARARLDTARAEEALSALSALGRAMGEASFPWAALSAVPELFVVEARAEVPRQAIEAALDEALSALTAHREREGAQLGRDLVARLAACDARVRGMASRSESSVARLAERLRQRVRAALGQGHPGVDAHRLEQEIALVAERSDVSEELTRLGAHLKLMASLFEEGGAIGRKLDFLLQELTREANTLGAKTTETEVSHAVIELRAEIERMREQVQNIE